MNLSERDRLIVSVIVSAVVLAGGDSARAQEVDEPRGYAIERLRLSLDRDGVADTEWGAVLPHLSWEAGLWLTGEDDPLVVNRDGERVGALIHRRVGMSLYASVGFLGRLQLSLELPFILFQERDSTIPGVTAPEASLDKLGKLGLGDLRFAPKLSLLDQRRHGVSLAVIASFTVPSGGADDYRGEEGLTVAPELAVSRAFGPLRLAANLGYRYRSETSRFVDLTVEDELVLRAAAGYRFGVAGQDLPLEIDLAVSSATSASDPFAEDNQDASELIGQVVTFVGPVALLLGGGVGLLPGYGTPDVRLYAGTRFTARDEDPDHDGLVATDRCPRRPEDRDGFEDGDGCPDPDNDRDRVPDVSDGAPNDPEDRDGFEDADGVPELDNDKDGILDAADRCPDKAEVKNEHEDEDGCPDEAPDWDGDGLAGQADGCPREAEDRDGFEDGDGCPDPDNDKDRVLDVDDRCPAEPGPKENGGCPDGDSDGDSVVDRLDNCPNEPGTAENQGCKVAQQVQIVGDRLEILDSVYFKFNRAIIERRSYPLLDNVAQVILAHPEVGRVRVEGHTDSVGRDSSNLSLSQRRAEAVVAYLVKKGVPRERLEAVGYGETRPIADNETKAGRAQNRRVVFRLLDTPAGRIEDSGNKAGTDTLER